MTKRLGLSVATLCAMSLAACEMSRVPSSGAASAPTTGATPAVAKNLAHEKTKDGNFAVQPINHSALRFEFKGKQYYVDPAGQAEWAQMPKADVIFLTHEHPDHVNAPTITTLKKDGTFIIGSAGAVKQAGTGTVIAPGDKKDVLDIKIEAVAAYNLTADRLNFHPKDRKDVGFVFTFGEKRVYVAGDTEGTPEMKALKDIDIAFIPINLPYTMNPQEAADATKAFKPKVVYPYHQGQSKPEDFKKVLDGEKEIEVRVLALP
jgi:L-ascorbate metabolism protein UlaG (beta-lactamase superfamily)